MNTKNSLKLKVFESTLSKEDTSELVTMIEGATTVEDIDHINEVLMEKVKEVPYNEAKIIAMNNKVIETLKECEYAENFKEIIKSMEEYNKKLVELWKKGTDPQEDRQKFQDIWDEYLDKATNALNKVELKLQMEYAKLSAKGTAVSPEDTKKVKDELDACLDFKKKIKSVAKEMKDNVVEAAKKAKEVSKDKIDELREKIKEVSNKNAE